MAIPADGGSSPTPVIDELNPLYNDIANLLGELAGNEQYLATLEANFATDASTPDPMKVPQPPHTRMFVADFEVPGTYGFTLQHAYWGADGTPEGGTTPPIETENQLRKLAKQAYDQAKQAYSEAYGTVSGFRNAGQNIWEPDPEAMSLATTELGYFAQWLQDQQKDSAGWVSTDDSGAPTWLANLKKGWPATARASDSFYAFWDDVDDKCDHYLDIAARLTATCAQTTAAISAAQKNLLKITQVTKEHVVLALQQWQKWKGPSGAWPTGKFDDNEGTKKILDGIALGTGAIALFPVVDVVAGPVSVIAGAISLFMPAETEVMVATSAAKAYDIWDGYLTDVGKVDNAMTTALDTIHTKPQKDFYTGTLGFDAYVKMAKGNRHNWEPLPVKI